MRGKERKFRFVDKQTTSSCFAQPKFPELLTAVFTFHFLFVAYYQPGALWYLSLKSVITRHEGTPTTSSRLMIVVRSREHFASFIRFYTAIANPLLTERRALKTSYSFLHQSNAIQIPLCKIR